MCIILLYSDNRSDISVPPLPVPRCVLLVLLILSKPFPHLEKEEAVLALESQCERSSPIQLSVGVETINSTTLFKGNEVIPSKVLNVHSL